MLSSTVLHRLIAIVLILPLLAVLAVGQDRGRDEGRDRDRDRDENRNDNRDRDRDRGGRDFDPREIIRQADDNNDGVVDPSEVGQRSGYYIRRAAERAGLDPNRPIPAAQLMPALEAMRAENNAQNNSSNSSSRGSSPAPAVSGFGAPVPATGSGGGVPGFNVPLTVNSTASLDKKYDRRVIDYVEDMLRERDVNKNGVLEKNEWTGRWSTPPEESDTNKDGILDKEELCARIAKRFGNGSSGSSPSSATSSSSGSPNPYGAGQPGGSSSGGDAERYRRYAEGFIRQYDRNRDGKLDKDEASQMRSEHRAADVNSDGIITQDELQAKLQSYAGGSSSSSSSGGSSDGNRDGERRYGYGSRGSSGDNKTAVAPKKSFRITSPAERLPKGLPDWFLRGDADGDGQVSMAEYTTTWTEQLAAEFLKYDTDGNGIITPEECQAQSGPPRR
jgi:Ca2+-binding EF-hand superfamily protein